MNIFQYNMAQHDKCILLASKYRFAREYDLAKFYYNAACEFKQRALDCTFEMCEKTNNLDYVQKQKDVMWRRYYQHA